MTSMLGEHHYATRVEWQGNLGSGTSALRAFSRQHTLSAEGRHLIAGSADAPFRGDADHWNPELLLVGALSQCHMMSYLHVAVLQQFVVVAYEDNATGALRQRGMGGQMEQVTLRPLVTVAAQEMVTRAVEGHALAAEYCFIANSVNFPVLLRPIVRVEERPSQP